MDKQIPFRTWGVCEARGKTSVTMPPSSMPHNNMGRGVKCAWCGGSPTTREQAFARAFLGARMLHVRGSNDRIVAYQHAVAYDAIIDLTAIAHS